MRYPASEKLEIIRLVEQSHLPVRRTLEKLGIQPARFYRWYDRLQTGGLEALEDKASRPTRVWNRIPDAIRERIVQLALDEPELSPRELATRFTDTANYFVSEASVYRLLKARDLITSPAYIVMKAADEFKDKTTAPNQLIARVIGSIENDPTQLRNVVYELARIKLEREVWQRHPPLSMAEIRQLIAREKRDSLREEPAPPPCRLSLVAENRRHQLIGTERPCL